jgi:methylated-DNA-protein-cysteine methyltransferase-like protein
MTNATERILAEILALPKGRVSSYSAIAVRAGIPNGARQVARALHSLSEKHNLPWHRVIRKDGSIALEAGAGKELQMGLLRNEGVEVSSAGKVDMKRFGV